MTNQCIFMYIISDTNTDSLSEGVYYLVAPIPELPTCELYYQPPYHESILKKYVSELKITLFYLFLICVIIFVDGIVLGVLI